MIIKGEILALYDTMLCQLTSLVFEGKYDFANLHILVVSLGIYIYKSYHKARPQSQLISTAAMGGDIKTRHNF